MTSTCSSSSPRSGAGRGTATRSRSTWETQSNGLFRFRHGTLYPILHRLEADGLVRGDWSREGGGRKRKEYVLTAKGRRHLAGEADRMEEIMQRFLRLVRPPGTAPA